MWYQTDFIFMTPTCRVQRRYVITVLLTYIVDVGINYDAEVSIGVYF